MADPANASRRGFMQSVGGAAAIVSAGPVLEHAAHAATAPQAGQNGPRPVRLDVNGVPRMLTLVPGVTLLDALRDHLGLTGTKKGCDRGQCGACTVLVDGRRINACLTLAVMQEGARITTVEGLGTPEALHPMQAAFARHDAFQCGYCTPGQVCSAVALVEEVRAGTPSFVTADVRVDRPPLTDDEIRERMSGNLCRCGAYPNILAAVRQVVGPAGAAAQPGGGRA